ncbi:MAG: hypothetical protein WCY25_01915 [Moheibacter sp.]
MKKVFVKGFALAAVVALSFTNVSCEQKPADTDIEVINEEGVDNAEANLNEAVDQLQETTDSAAAIVDEAADNVEAAADNTAEQAQDAVQ